MVSLIFVRKCAIVTITAPVSRWCTWCVKCFCMSSMYPIKFYQDEGISFRSTISNAYMCKIEPIVISIGWWIVPWHRKVIIVIGLYVLRLMLIRESGVILMHVWHEPVLKSDNILYFFPYIFGKFFGPCNNYEESYYNFTSFVHCFKSQCLSHATVYGLYELYLWETLQFCSMFASWPCSFGQFLHVP